MFRMSQKSNGCLLLSGAEYADTNISGRGTSLLHNLERTPRTVTGITARLVGFEVLCGGGALPRPRGEAPSPHKQNLLRDRFLIDHNLQVRGHILVQLYRNDKFADTLKRFVQLNLPAIDVEAFLLERVGNIASCDRSEQVISLA